MALSLSSILLFILCASTIDCLVNEWKLSDDEVARQDAESYDCPLVNLLKATDNEINQALNLCNSQANNENKV